MIYITQHLGKNHIFKIAISSLTCAVVLIHSALSFAGDDLAKEKRAFELYDQINSTDIVLGDLALNRGTHPVVKSFGIDKNYREIRTSARKIAQSKGIWESAEAYPEIVPACFADVENLKVIPTESFDKSFIQHERGYLSYAVGAIKNDILPGVSSPELKELLNNHLQRLEAHKKNISAARKSLKNR